MLSDKKIANKNIKLISIGLVILILTGLNFYMLNKVIGNSKENRVYKKNIRI